MPYTSPDQTVSRLHGRIWEEDHCYWIEDLNSLRGTLVNGIEIRHAESGIAIGLDVDATAVDPLPLECADDAKARRLKMVYDLPFQFATRTTLESSCWQSWTNW
jgi:hypothetical protein